MINKPLFLLLLFAFSFSACTRNSTGKAYFYDYDTVSLDTLSSSDALESMIKPYREKVEAEMDKVIGEVMVPLVKEQPESTMGNFFTDMLVEEVEEDLEREVDICVMNYGGMRIPVIDSGSITVGDIYEFMPFDNTLVLCEVNGAQVMELFRHLLKDGGWPLSKGVQLTKDGDEIIALVNGKLISNDTQYTVLVNNYIANGGDGCAFIKEWEQENLNGLIRDQLIEGIRELTEEGAKVFSELDGRIIIFDN